MTFTHLGLFEGIGGFSLAVKELGGETLAWCEWNSFCQTILKYHFPESEPFSDITKTSFKEYEGKIDLLTGGFPCQPFSLAGNRKGSDDERYLWPEMLRAIQEVKPRCIIAENVYGIINIDRGMVFEQVCIDLESEGYEVQAFIIPACAKNAPHRRDRVWFVAFNANSSTSGESENMGRKNRKGISGSFEKGVFQKTDDKSFGFCEVSPKERSTTNSRLLGQEKCEKQTTGIEQCDKGTPTHTNGIRGRFKNDREREGAKEYIANCEADTWQIFPTQSPICGGDDGLPTELDGITFSKWRNESIKAYGNAIVPQVAKEIIKQILKITP